MREGATKAIGARTATGVGRRCGGWRDDHHDDDIDDAMTNDTKTNDASRSNGARAGRGVPGTRAGGLLRWTTMPKKATR